MVTPQVMEKDSGVCYSQHKHPRYSWVSALSDGAYQGKECLLGGVVGGTPNPAELTAQQVFSYGFGVSVSGGFTKNVKNY